MKILIILLSTLILLSCHKQEGYILKREFSGAPENTWVFLTDMNQQICYDSVQIRNGQFEFRGKLENPELYCVTYFKDPSQRIYGWNNILRIPVFMENAKIRLSVPFIDIPTKLDKRVPANLQILGSQSHDLYAIYRKVVEPLEVRDDSLFDAYRDIFYYKKGTEEDIFRCVREMDSIREAIFNTGVNFIRKYPESPVALYVAKTLKVTAYGRDKAQEIASLFSDAIKTTLQGQQAIKALLEHPLYKNDKLPDFDVLTTEQKVVKLSTLLKKEHYTLVELWASWCGPCRADIPHLKETYDKYHDKGFEIVSISIDDNVDDWLKAVKQENMPWIQVCGANGKSYEKECMELFGVTGVPSCVLIDGKGRVVSISARGGWLNETLSTLFLN